jgi:hypothetical protein
VAIPLRENARIYSLNSIPLMPQEKGWKVAPTNRLSGRRSGDFKLLKLLILRVIWRLLKLYHTSEVFEGFSGTLNRVGKLDLCSVI